MYPRRPRFTWRLIHSWFWVGYCPALIIWSLYNSGSHSDFLGMMLWVTRIGFVIILVLHLGLLRRLYASRRSFMVIFVDIQTHLGDMQIVDPKHLPKDSKMRDLAQGAGDFPVIVFGHYHNDTKFHVLGWEFTVPAGQPDIDA